MRGEEEGERKDDLKKYGKESIEREVVESTSEERRRETEESISRRKE